MHTYTSTKLKLQPQAHLYMHSQTHTDLFETLSLKSSQTVTILFCLWVIFNRDFQNLRLLERTKQSGAHLHFTFCC